MRLMTKCGAKTRTGEPCKSWALPVGRCRMHGGTTPRGYALPQTTQGRYSRDVPTRMAARYAEAQDDPDLLSLRSEVHLLDSRIVDVLARVDTGESGWIWQKLKATANELKAARRAGDNAGIAVALTTLLSLVEAGHQDYAAWSDVRSLLDQRTRITAAEHKRNVDLQQTMSVNQFMLLAGSLVAVLRDSILANVSDAAEQRRALAAATAGVQRLISVGDRETIES